MIDDAAWRNREASCLPNDGATNQAIRELEILSNEKFWWVRLYVAEVLRNHHEFSSQGIIERLVSDEASIVQEAIGPKPMSEAATENPH